LNDNLFICLIEHAGSLDYCYFISPSTLDHTWLDPHQLLL